jgi:glycosyltransferase involved in cell wall biosynthesis
MADAQAQRGWEVHLAMPRISLPAHDDGGAEGDPAESGLVVRHDWAAQRQPMTGLRQEASTLRRIVAAVDPDVVTLHSSKAGLVGRLVLRGSRPTLFLPHAWSFLALRGPTREAARRWEIAAARWTNAAVAVSAAEAAIGVRAGIRAPMFVVRNPELRGSSARPGGDRSTWRGHLGLGDRPTVVCVGRICRQKGQDVLLRAWRSVTEVHPTAVLVLVGDGPRPAGPVRIDDAEDRCRSSVVFAGHHPDPRPFLFAADVVAVPSRWEGCSLAMLEAMAVGRSVVTTAVAGSEVVAEARAGAVVPSEDPDAMARALVERLRNKRTVDEEGRRGAAHVGTHHRFDTAVDRLAAVTARAHAFGRAQPRTSRTMRRTAAAASSGRYSCS